MPSGNATFQANGNITPNSFVKQDTTADNKVLLCGAAGKVIGVSGEWTRNAPYSTLDDGYHAIAGENCKVYQIGAVCPLKLGGTVVRGDYLKSDASGFGVAAATTNQYYAVALQSGVANTVIEVELVTGTMP